MFRISAADLSEISNLGPSGYLMLLKAYLDESRHSDGPTCVVAGWVGTSEQWASCEKEWLEALGRKKQLHMTRLRWNSQRDRLKRLLDKMGPIPARHGLLRVAAGMKHQDYKEIVVGTLAERALQPYLGCVMYCLHAILSEMRSHDRLHLYLEQQDKYAHLVGLLNQTVLQADKRVMGLTFLRKDECVSFQPADYLAFHMSTRAIDPLCDKAVLTRPIYGPGIGWNYQRKDLERHIGLIAKESPQIVRRASLISFGASRKKKAKKK